METDNCMPASPERVRNVLREAAKKSGMIWSRKVQNWLDEHLDKEKVYLHSSGSYLQRKDRFWFIEKEPPQWTKPEISSSEKGPCVLEKI